MNFTFVLPIFITLCSLSTANAEDDKKTTYKDSKTGEYVVVCSQDKDVYYVAGACGKYWKKSPRKRSEIIAEVSTYKDVKKGSDVMIPVRKNGEVKWVLGKVSFMYEDGSISAIEYYTNIGPTGGTTSWTMPYEYLSKVNPAPAFESKKELCFKEKYDMTYGQNDNRKYSFEKGERVLAHETYANNMIGISYQGFAKNLFSYGMNNKLPVPLNKLEACPKDLTAVDDRKRDIKAAIPEIKPTDEGSAVNLQK